MTREERCELAIQRGFTYDAETGEIFNRYGKTSKPNKASGYHEMSVTVNKKSFKIQGHQFVWYYEHGYCANELDHINGIKHDNRICNLRPVTHQQNNWNRVNAKGYHMVKNRNKYRAEIRLNTKKIYLGLHNTEEEARNAYLKAKEIYHKI
jgi:hypothetical protein